LKRYSIPATVFLTTDCLSRNSILFHDQLLYSIGAARVTQFALPELGPGTYSLTTESERVQVYKEVSARLKKIPNAERATIIEKLSEVLLVSENEMRQNIRMLSWSEIREMQDSGLVTFGAHSASHPILSRVPIEEAKYEVLHSKLVIEEELNVSVRFLAYPNGKEADFNETIKEVVRQSGYELAFTTIEKPIQQYDPYEMPRSCIDNEDISRFKLLMSGFFDIVEAVKNKKIDKREPL
jgi:peptidoglycan/xylan/chitin deacetylase (PgdA/CDA1 family)